MLKRNETVGLGLGGLVAGAVIGWCWAVRTLKRIPADSLRNAEWFETNMRRYTAMVRLDERSKCVHELEELSLLDSLLERRRGTL